MDTIYQGAVQCSSLFEKWQVAATEDDNYTGECGSQELVDLENSLFRFTLWSDHYSAMSRGRDSLDWRLRKSEVSHSVVLDLMEDLAQAVSVKMGLREASKSCANLDPELVLDQLFRYSRAIRRSGALRRLAKATDYVEYDEETGVNLTANFREAADQYLGVALGPMDRGLRGRLLDTICIRQQSFAFQRSRRESKQDSLVPETDISRETPQASSRAGSAFGVRRTVAGTTKSVSKVSRHSMLRQRVGAPASEATTFVSNASQVTNRELEPGRSSITFELEELPVRPKISLGEKEHECPYCFTICPIADFTDNGWPLHIVRDLMPFVCTLKDCSSPNVLYTSMNAWSSHMKNAHSRKGWICMDPDHSHPLHFLQLEEFKLHISSEHEIGISDQELDVIAEECFEVLHEDTLPGICPFPCDVNFDIMGNGEREEHVAKHLIALAQKSLMDYDPIGPLDYGSAAGVSSRFGSDSAQVKDSLNAHVALIEEESDQQDSHESGNIVLSEDLVPSEEIEMLSRDILEWDRVCSHILIQNAPVDYSQLSDPKLQNFIHRPSYSESETDSDQEDVWEDVLEMRQLRSHMRRLRTLILENSIKSGFERTPHKFVPEGVIDELITEERIKMILGPPISTREETELVDFIRMRAKKVFAILIYIRTPSLLTALKWWRRKYLDDRDLPIMIQPLRKKQSWFGDFCVEQWAFLAPVFTTTQYNHDLDKAHILPFVSKESDSFIGSSGIVSQYFIHRNHLNPALPKDTPFAIKICVYEDERKVADHWESEVKVLQAMNELNREHIVRFITAFRRPREHGGSEHYMIIEWADGGNLRSMWKRNPVPNLTVALIKDAMFQILGLATALEAAHSLNVNGVSYCHGDLKPENILCFDNGRTIGTLKIGDWGQAKEHRSMTEMRPSEVAEAFGTRLYEPPEAETGIIFRLPGQSTRRHSRLYDIWAMGCITLEFIIWLLRGWEGLVQFHSDIGERTFYEIIVSNGRREAQLHSAAKSWMDSMANDPRCQVGSTALGDLLELVRTALLVVKLPRRPGKVWKDRLEVFRTDSVSNLGPEVGGSGVKNGPFRIEETPHSPPELPTFTITPADPEPERDPILPELEKSRPVRCLATDFRSQMEHIVAEDPDEAEGYWLAYQSQSLEVRAT